MERSNCGKKGHRAQECRNKKTFKKGIAAIEGASTKVILNGKEEGALVDTGSCNSLVSSHLVDSFDSYSDYLICANGQKLNLVGKKLLQY